MARDAHFEVYSEAGPESARLGLTRFEQLRAFFLARGFPEPSVTRPPIRVVAFESERKYGAFRLRPVADAFYVGTESHDYIVLPGLTSARFAMAAHEYAHLVLRTSNWKLPLWLNEGLAEYFSTTRIAEDRVETGGDLPARMQLLVNGWIPLPKLCALSADVLASESRPTVGLFYAESWRLTDLLLSSPLYAPQFRQFIAAVNAGVPPVDALTKTYNKTLDAITADVRSHRSVASHLPGIPAPALRISVAPVSDYERRFVLASLLAADGELNRARSMFEELVQIRPEDANVFAALGEAALRRGDKQEARRKWKAAIDLGIKSAGLCYRYAVLAGEQNVTPTDIRPALERAVELDPSFDSARYSLALLESNAGEFEQALSQLRAMRVPAGDRAFAYWCTLAYAATELDQREEAEQAAQAALQAAKTPADRTRARQLSFIASTDLTVQFAQDQNGQTRLVTTRVPHGTKNFNPFIQSQDHIEHAEGKLLEVRCGAGALTGFVIGTEKGPLPVSVPDPSRVLMRNSPPEFACGPQQPPQKAVVVEYAAQGSVLRGMDFR